MAVCLMASGVLLVLLTGCAIPLLNAAAAGDIEEVSLLLKQGHLANEALPIIGIRPLTLAAAYGHADVVRVLLEHGAEINAEDFTGWTALHAGSFTGDSETISLLLDRGAVSGSDRWFLRSPLKIAETLDHKDIIPLLQKSEQVRNGSNIAFKMRPSSGSIAEPHPAAFGPLMVCCD